MSVWLWGEEIEIEIGGEKDEWGAAAVSVGDHWGAEFIGGFVGFDCDLQQGIDQYAWF